MTTTIAGSAAQALASLTNEQIAFIRNLPKAELHAHLNGSIPLPTLQQLANDFVKQISDDSPQTTPSSSSKVIQDGLSILSKGVELAEIGDFFGLFPAIYALTSNPSALRRVASDVLETFLKAIVNEDGSILPPECTYIELRTTPRSSSQMTRREYLEAVLDEVEQYPDDQAALIVSIDRRMSVDDAHECIDLAIALRDAGRRVVGVDLCGSPDVGDMNSFLPVFNKVRASGLGLTLHIAEITSADVVPDTDILLSADPSRLGHATFLTVDEVRTILAKRIPIEICLTSNLCCKTVSDLKDHHIHSYLQAGHPIAICTDDVLVFRTSLTAEYALLLAQPPLGLGLSQSEVTRIAELGIRSKFRHAALKPVAEVKEHLKSQPIPTHILGSKPGSPVLMHYLDSLASSSPFVQPPELQCYPNSVYMNHHSLGISLLFTPVNGYKPRSGTALDQLRNDDLVLESVDVYNVSPPLPPTPPPAPPERNKTKLANAQYSPYPALPIQIPGTESDGAIFHLFPESTGKDFVSFFGEPSRKGGGSGPAGGSIGIWCEWKPVGLMVEFGGDEAKGSQAWERGKDAKWAVITFFVPEGTT
ncbi:hypothetical protein FRB94_009258 [Tulasnella sp. JGI-2019a]|nr:hypothetical protein FRB94_009258 [Tulasnella sp. JGI-2019a]KAG9016516.1 hypothetical protein FRB93_010765 [Tulasnella sp. JGI-2019a]